MIDYKNTLNLPYTKFPMKANLNTRELEIYAYWQSIQLYDQLRTRAIGKPKFILHDGPPYANGRIHIGHAVNKILKDIIVKSKTMSGFDAPFIPGWDCHGLPIELNIEKKQGTVGTQLDAPAFRHACREHARTQIVQQRAAFQRLGVLGDWEHPYLTMDFNYEANTIRVLAKLLRAGYIQRGFKPVHWCIACASALAEAEVDYLDKQSTALDVRFPVVDPDEFWQRVNLPKQTLPVAIPIWTTTAWTLPANQAVALHPEIEYAVLQIENQYLILACALLESCLLRYGTTEYKILTKIPGYILEGLLLKHPFYERSVPIVLGKHVTCETGTGAVHTAPAHGQEDYLLGLQYKLRALNIVGIDGCYLPNTDLFASMSVLAIEPQIVSVLQQRGNLLSEAKIQHSYPHCWRHKTPLIFLATQQWFIRMHQPNLASATLAAINQVRWIPQWGHSRMSEMIQNRPDWCISRQRSWGVPIPLFVHIHSGQWHPKSFVFLENIAQRIEQDGIEAWYALKSEDLLGPDNKEYERLNDVLDVWFESGITHETVLQLRLGLNYPADLYLEGSDQYRGWFQSSLLTSVALHQQAPYRTVLTHGFVVDEQGKKMSKSLGNVVDPEKVITKFGSDILRLWVAATDYRGEIAVSEQILQRMTEAYRRIRNTVRFLLANLHDFDPATDQVAIEHLLSLDHWILERAHLIQRDSIKAYEQYQFHVIYQKIHHFCIHDLGSFYLDIIKDRQYTLQKFSRARRSAQTALYHILEAMVRWLAPILSFTAEEIWQHLPGQREPSVFLAPWHTIPINFSQDPLRDHYQQPSSCQHYWDTLIRVRDEVNKELEVLRHTGAIGSALEAEVTLYITENSDLGRIMQAIQTELHFLLLTSSARIIYTTLPAHLPSVIDNSLAIEAAAVAVDKIKCKRCWHRRVDVGQHSNHPNICLRCISNLPEGAGEKRYYV